MTRQLRNLTARSAGGKETLLRPLRHGRNLAEEVVERIAGEIRAGRLVPGARLPTEQELMAAMGVSRTVVREAVAALRAEGFVVTRQGSGAFVAADAGQAPFRIAPEALGAIEAVIAVMELRLAVEVEAAALAAERADGAGIGTIERRHGEFAAAVARGDAAITEDFAFHQAIAAATGNVRFAQFLAFLGQHVIPRQSIRATSAGATEQRVYLAGIEREHERIAAAIRARDPAAARRAMRRHLLGSLGRYRILAGRAVAKR